MNKYHISKVLLSIILIASICMSFFYAYAQVNDIRDESAAHAASGSMPKQFEISFPELMFSIKTHDEFCRFYPAWCSEVFCLGEQPFATQHYYHMLQYYFIFLLGYVVSLLIIVIWNQSKDGKKRISSLLNNKLNRRIKLV